MTESHEQPKVDSYADASPLVRLLNTEGRVRLLDVFLGKSYQALTTKEVAKLAGVNESTFYRNVGPLLEMDLIRKGSDGGEVVYTLNQENELATKLREAQIEALEYSQETTNLPLKTEIREMISRAIQIGEKSPDRSSEEGQSRETHVGAVMKKVQ